MSDLSRPLCAVLLLPMLAPAARPAAPPAVARDRYGDPLPRGAVARFGSLRFRLPAGQYPFAMSPDGEKVFLQGYRKPALAVLDAASGNARPLALPSREGHLSWVVSPDGRRALARCDGVLTMYDLGTNKQLWAVKTTTPEGRPAFDPAGTHLARMERPDSGRTTVFVHRADTGEQTARLTLEGDERGVALSPGGSRLLSWHAPQVLRGFPDPDDRGTAEVLLWDTVTGKRLGTARVKSGPFAVAAFRPDGKEFAVASWAVVGVHDATDAKPRHTLRAAARVRLLTYSPDGNQLAAASAGQVSLWDTRSWRRSSTRQGPAGAPAALAFPEGRVTVVSAVPPEVLIWDAITGKVTGRSPAGHRGPVTSLRFDGDRLLTAGGDLRVVGWDLSGRHLEAAAVREVHEQGLDDRILRFGGSDGRWLPGWERGHFVFDRRDSRVCLDQLDDIAAEHHTGLAQIARNSPLLVSATHREGDDRELDVWLTATRLDRCEQLWSVQIKGEMAHALAVAADGRFVAAMVAVPKQDREQFHVRLFDGATGKPLAGADAPAHDGHVGDVLEFSPDGRRLFASTEGGGIILLDVRTGRRVHSIRCEHSVRKAVFGPRGRTLAILLQEKHGRSTLPLRQRIQVIELSSGRERLRLQTGDIVTSLGFSPDGRRLAAGYEDGTALLWDLEPERGAGKGDVWKRLAGADAADAYRAMWQLKRDPKTAVELVRRHVRPAPPGPSAGEVGKLIAALDDEESPLRDKAQQAIRKHGRHVEPALRAALAARPSPEVSRRVKRLLEALPPLFAPEAVPALRAVELLEMVGTREAKEVLSELARGGGGAILTREARAALARLDR